MVFIRNSTKDVKAGLVTLGESDQSPFAAAVEQARLSLAQGGIPIGAALEIAEELVAVGHNERVQLGDPIAHGEIACLRNAGRIADYRASVLYTTLAPCAMCAGAIVQFGIPRLVVGESRSFPGELDWLRSRGVELRILDSNECVGLMDDFKRRYPETWAEDIGEPPA